MLDYPVLLVGPATGAPVWLDAANLPLLLLEPATDGSSNSNSSSTGITLMRLRAAGLLAAPPGWLQRQQVELNATRAAVLAAAAAALATDGGGGGATAGGGNLSGSTVPYPALMSWQSRCVVRACGCRVRECGVDTGALGGHVYGVCFAPDETTIRCIGTHAYRGCVRLLVPPPTPSTLLAVATRNLPALARAKPPAALAASAAVAHLLEASPSITAVSRSQQVRQCMWTCRPALWVCSSLQHLQHQDYSSCVNGIRIL